MPRILLRPKFIYLIEEFKLVDGFRGSSFVWPHFNVSSWHARKRIRARQRQDSMERRQTRRTLRELRWEYYIITKINPPGKCKVPSMAELALYTTVSYTRV